MVATSTPAASSAVKAEAGARKVNSLAAAVPRSVMAVSRLTTARSARRSTPPIGPKVVAGSLARRVATAPSKWTSPPKAMVTGAPVGSLPAPARGGEVVVARGRAVVLVEVAPESPPSPPPPQPLRASAARARAARVRRPASRDTADSRLGLGEAALACHAAVRRRSQRRARSRARRDRLLARARWSRSAAARRSSARWFTSSKYGQLPGGCGAQLICVLLVSQHQQRVYTGVPGSATGKLGRAVLYERSFDDRPQRARADRGAGQHRRARLRRGAALLAGRPARLAGRAGPARRRGGGRRHGPGRRDRAARGPAGDAAGERR